MTKRYYAWRVEPGLYVQPSDDGRRRFVVCSYEDGRKYGLDSGPYCATYWTWGEMSHDDISRVERLLALGEGDELLRLLREIAFDDTGYPTKRAAIEAALSHGT